MEELSDASRLAQLQNVLSRLCGQLTGAMNDLPRLNDRWQDTLLAAMDYIASRLPSGAHAFAGYGCRACKPDANYLRKLFKDFYNESLSDYIRRLRIEKQKRF